MPPILMDAAVDPTGGILSALPTVAGAAGSVIVVVFLFLRHLEAVHTRYTATIDRLLGQLKRPMPESGSDA